MCSKVLGCYQGKQKISIHGKGLKGYPKLLPCSGRRVSGKISAPPMEAAEQSFRLSNVMMILILSLILEASQSHQTQMPQKKTEGKSLWVCSQRILSSCSFVLMLF
uniref:Uncharacterized protein n=1 Tax=Opuntia streptacantha TaxID=393608 RepID=A0A7C9EQE1_OPUST